MRRDRDLSLLWALRSPCNLGCRYCYFGTLEDDRALPPEQPGVLSHLPHGDLPFDQLAAFLGTAARSRLGRVFLAGGEPLIWPHAGDVVGLLTAAGVEVIVCTNGIPLNRPRVRRMLRAHGVHAVSVSLDSADPGLNDRFRSPRRPGEGWHAVVSGIAALVADRGSDRWAPRIGLYTVLTRLNLPGLEATARLAADLGVDYFVPQPISLAADHPLRAELALRPEDRPAVVDAFGALYAAGLPLRLPGPLYPAQVAATAGAVPARMLGCFGGSTLAFVEPDGSVWDCPSRYRIAATAGTERQNSIVGTTAAALFPLGSTPGRVTARSTRMTASTCGRLSMTSTASSPRARDDRADHPGHDNRRDSRLRARAGRPS